MNGPKFDPAVYTKMTLNDLVVYSIYHLYRQGGEITSEDIVSACFTLFPKRFSLRKYPQWPDSAVITRRWSDLRNKGYIVGNTAKGFKLTARGIRFAQKLSRMLGSQATSQPQTRTRSIPPEVKTRAGRFVRAMETSDAFRRFKKYGIHAEVGEFDFRDLLLCTMESPAAVLERNLEQYKEYAGIYDRQDLLTFLNFCEDRFAHLLNPGHKEPVRQSDLGGLLKSLAVGKTRKKTSEV
ncbi:MAG: hypothetical protein AB1649_08865 [Chloroflexota bacterium]